MAEGEGRHVTVENERESVMRNPNVLSVMHGELQQAYEGERFQDRSGSWHADSHCPELYISGLEIQNRVPCPFCAPMI